MKHPLQRSTHGMRPRTARRGRAPLRVALLLGLLAAACGKLDAAEAPAMARDPEAQSRLEGDALGGVAAPKPSVSGEKAAPRKRLAKMDDAKEEVAAEMDSPIVANAVAPGAPPAEAAPEAAPTPTRAWFPETMLFAPRVITDGSGSATLNVPVPDRLTTWRVLALAHSRQGAQAGSLSSFTSNLPVSVDLVVPPFLVAGDSVSLPVQVVNSTDQALTRPLTLRAEGARLLGAPSSVSVDARGTRTLLANLEANAPGTVALEATLPGEDSVLRSIPVLSPGKPFRVEKGGTLAAARAPSLSLPEGVLDGSAHITLTVVPGALSLLRAELASAPLRSSLDDEAFLLLLSGRAPALAASLHATLEPARLKHLERLAGQRLARRAINPDLDTALKLAPGALAHPKDTLIGRNGAHLAGIVARAQRPDGTFGGGSGVTVQRLMVTTADGLAVLRAGSDANAARAATLRGRGAFERFAGQVDDPYTAAAILASGAVDGAFADELAKKVREALVTRDDGARALPVPVGALRADGSSPTEVEATALAVRALFGRAEASALLPDLGATLLSAWRPGAGFGDGATNAVALQAVALLFTDPLPTRVAVSLSVDGKTVGSATLEGDKLVEQQSLSAPLAKVGAALALGVVADPPVPGLSFVVSVEGATPWPTPPSDAGLALEVDTPALAVGRPATLTLRATAPDGAGLRLTHALPAGVDPVRSSLQALVDAGTLSEFEIAEGKVVLVAPERGQGEAFAARYSVIPSLAGTLHSTASSAELDGDESSRVYFPPRPWRVATR